MRMTSRLVSYLAFALCHLMCPQDCAANRHEIAVVTKATSSDCIWVQERTNSRPSYVVFTIAFCGLFLHWKAPTIARNVVHSHKRYRLIQEDGRYRVGRLAALCRGSFQSHHRWHRRSRTPFEVSIGLVRLWCRSWFSWLNSAFGRNALSCCTRFNIALDDFCVLNRKFMFNYGV